MKKCTFMKGTLSPGILSSPNHHFDYSSDNFNIPTCHAGHVHDKGVAKVVPSAASTDLSAFTTTWQTLEKNL